MNVCISAGADAMVASDALADAATGGDPCTAKYGQQNGYQLCFETPTECGFEAAKNGVASCIDVCRAFGGQCLRGLGNDSSDPCTPTSEPPDGCSRTAQFDDICVCSL